MSSPAPEPNDPTPPVSVIIPARAAVDSLPGTLNSVLSQDYPAIVDIVVAAADEPTARAAKSTGDERIHVVANPEGSTPSGLNRALAASSGVIVVRCDAHAQLPPAYVSGAVATLIETEAVNVGGRQLPAGLTPFERAVGLAMVSPIGAGDARYRLGGPPGPVDTVYLGVFRRSAVDAVGGFDESLLRNQDYELNWRLRQAGGVVWFDPTLTVGYRPRGSVTGLARQYFEYGRWKREVIRRHPDSWRWRQLAPPTLVAGLALSAAAAATRSRLASVVPSVYLATTIGAAVWDLGRTRQADALLEPMALWTMHLAWGWGFIIGPPSDRR